jgi:tetratricopeptide (TPR) repeat protein
MTYLASLEPHGAGAARMGQGFGRLWANLLTISRTGTLACAAGALVATAFIPFARRHLWIPWAAAAALVFDYAGATLSPALYGHYFLQMVPSFVLCGAAAGSLLLEIVSRAVPSIWLGRALLLALPCLLDLSALDAYRVRVQEPFVSAPEGPVSQLVRARARPGDGLWVSHIADARFYVETGLSAPTPFIHYFAGWFTDTAGSTGAEKKARLVQDLTAHPPAYVVIDEDAPSLGEAGIMRWICGRYRRAPVEDQGFLATAHLYVREDRASADMPAGQPAPDTPCAKELVNDSSVAYQRGDWKAARDAAAAAVALDPRNAEAFIDLCVSSLQLGEPDRAIASCEAALALDPSNTLARNNLVWAQNESRKRQAAPPRP